MGDRNSVRQLKTKIAHYIKKTPVFRDHSCRVAENTLSCAICEIYNQINTYPLAALSVLRHFNFIEEGYLPEESDLFDLLGPDKVNRMIEEEQRRMFGTVKVRCRSCSHEFLLFNTYQHNLLRSEGTTFYFKCTKCQNDNEVDIYKEEDRIKLTKRSKYKIRNTRHTARTAVTAQPFLFTPAERIEQDVELPELPEQETEAFWNEPQNIPEAADTRIEPPVARVQARENTETITFHNQTNPTLNPNFGDDTGEGTT